MGIVETPIETTTMDMVRIYIFFCCSDEGSRKQQHFTSLSICNILSGFNIQFI